MTGKASKSFFPPGLRDSRLVTIMYDDGAEHSVPEEIFRIPKRVAAYFSPVLKDCFPPENQHHANRRGCDGRNVATVSGSVKRAYICIFYWMLYSCEEDRFARLDGLEFAKCARVHEAAVLLGIHKVERIMLNRMQAQANFQVNCEDVRMVYATYPKESVVRQMVIESIGNAIMDRRLRAWSKYQDFRVECAEYDRDIYEYTQAKKREMRAFQRAEGAKARARARANKQAVSSSRREKQETKPTVVDKTVSAPLARKGKGGRPSYYKIPLDDLGVSTRRVSTLDRRTKG